MRFSVFASGFCGGGVVFPSFSINGCASRFGVMVAISAFLCVSWFDYAYVVEQVEAFLKE